MTLFNYWHYIVLSVLFMLFLSMVITSLQQPKKKLILPMLFSSVLVITLLSVLGIMIVDKYTKIVKLYKLKNKRLLSTEQIVYTGIVKNEGNYKIGTVTFTIKLVNQGHATGKIQSTSFYSPKGFYKFIVEDSQSKAKPQTISKEFVVAKNLKPGTIQRFRVYFKYPSYFRNTAQFASVGGH